jgi:hypothetical protein
MPPKSNLYLMFLLVSEKFLSHFIRGNPENSQSLRIGGEIHDSTRRCNLEHSRDKSLPQPPHSFLPPNLTHQPQRRRVARIHLPSRLTHIKRLRNKRRKSPAQPPRQKRRFKESPFPASTEDFVLRESVSETLVAQPVAPTEGHVTPEREIQASPQRPEALLLDQGGYARHDALE